MQKSEIILSLFYNGQLFTALFERSDETGYAVSQKNFAISPSDNEIFELITKGYNTLSFSTPSREEASDISKPARNPKKRQREAARAIDNVCASTKAQQALKLQHDEHVRLSKSTRIAREELIADRKYELYVQKRKQKHKGR